MFNMIWKLPRLSGNCPGCLKSFQNSVVALCSDCNCTTNATQSNSRNAHKSDNKQTNKGNKNTFTTPYWKEDIRHPRNNCENLKNMRKHEHCIIWHNWNIIAMHWYCYSSCDSWETVVALVGLSENWKWLLPLPNIVYQLLHEMPPAWEWHAFL